MLGWVFAIIHCRWEYTVLDSSAKICIPHDFLLYFSIYLKLNKIQPASQDEANA